MSDGAQREMTREELLESLQEERTATQWWKKLCEYVVAACWEWQLDALTAADEIDKYHHERDEARAKVAALGGVLQTTCLDECSVRPDERTLAHCEGCRTFSALSWVLEGDNS